MTLWLEIVEINGWKLVDDMVADVTQQECSNNKCYASTFRYIQI